MTELENVKVKVAFITGITGQDGSYLAELLLEKGYDVWGTIRRSSSKNTGRIEHIFSRLTLRYGDLTDSMSLMSTLGEIKNTYLDRLEVLECYNLGAMSHVKVSFELPEYAGNADGLGTLRLLEALRGCGIPLSKTRFYQASTSEMFGKVQTIPQNEMTPFYPRSPYGIAKLYGHWITRNYREAYGMFACCGILFNHESERRGHTFVTRKITLAIANIVNGSQSEIVLGNLDSQRDWGHAQDYVRGMWLMMQQLNADDYVLSTNEYHTVREFIEIAFSCCNMEIEWHGMGINEVGVDKATGIVRIRIDSKYFRPSEVDELLGDYTKARTILGWEPTIRFKDLVKQMVTYDIANFPNI